MAALPPGVYFNPSPEECVRDYLRPWIGRGCADAAARALGHGSVFPGDVYAASPAALAGAFPRGHARGAESRWYFLALVSRGKRAVATGGNWKVEQRTKDLDDDDLDDAARGSGAWRRTYGFYGPGKRKTAWLMEELDVDGGGGSRGRARGDRSRSAPVPVFCRVYVSPRAEDDVKRALLGEDAVAVDADGKAKPAEVAVHEDYFDVLASLLPPRCVRGYGGHPAGVVLGHHDHLAAGQADAAPPDFPGHQHFQHAPPEAFHGEEHGHDALQQEIHGHQEGHAAPPDVHGHQHYDVVQQAEAPPDFLGQDDPHGLNDAGIDHPPAPPQQGEEGDRAEKKPRLTDRTLPACETEASQFQEEYDNTADAAFLQEPQRGSTGPAPEPPVASGSTSVSLPLPHAIDAFQAPPKAPSSSPSDGSSDLSNLTHVSLDDDFGMLSSDSQLMFDGLPMNFFHDAVPLGDLLGHSNFDGDSWIDDLRGLS